MEEYLKNEMRLIECYRGSSNKGDAEEKCQGYADKMKEFVAQGGFTTANALKEEWKMYYKTRNYYAPKN